MGTGTRHEHSAFVAASLHLRPVHISRSTFHPYRCNGVCTWPTLLPRPRRRGGSPGHKLGAGSLPRLMHWWRMRIRYFDGRICRFLGRTSTSIPHQCCDHCH